MSNLWSTSSRLGWLEAGSSAGSSRRFGEDESSWFGGTSLDRPRELEGGRCLSSHKLGGGPFAFVLGLGLYVFGSLSEVVEVYRDKPSHLLLAPQGSVIHLIHLFLLLIGLALVVASEIDVDIYFRSNQSIALVVAAASLLRYGVLAGMNGGYLLLWINTLPMIPWLYLLIFFQSIINRRSSSAYSADDNSWWFVGSHKDLRSINMSDILILSSVLDVAVDMPIDLGLCLYISPDLQYRGRSFLVSAVVLVCFDLLGLVFVLVFGIHSIKRGDSKTIRFYTVLFGLLFAHGLRQLGYLIIRIELNLKNLTSIEITVTAIMTAVAAAVAFMMAFRTRTESRLRRRKERIFHECLQRRPPKPFPRSEFMLLWQFWRRRRDGTEAKLLEAVLDAVEWCFERPARTWPYLEENIFELPIWEHPATFGRLQRLAMDKKAAFEAKIRPIVAELVEQERARLRRSRVVTRAQDGSASRGLRWGGSSRGSRDSSRGSSSDRGGGRGTGTDMGRNSSVGDEGDADTLAPLPKEPEVAAGEDKQRDGTLDDEFTLFGEAGVAIGEDGQLPVAEMRLPSLAATVESLLRTKPDARFERDIDLKILPSVLRHFAEAAYDDFKSCLREALPRAVVESEGSGSPKANALHGDGVKDMTLHQIEIRVRRDKCIKSVARMQQKVEEYRREAQEQQERQEEQQQQLQQQGEGGGGTTGSITASGAQSHRAGAGSSSNGFPFAAKIGDALRASVTVDSAESIGYVWRQLHAHFDVIRTKNKFVSAGAQLERGGAVGFPDLLLNVLVDVPGVSADATRIIAEVQIHHRGILEVGKNDHKLYEVLRASSIRPLRASGRHAAGGRDHSMDTTAETARSVTKANYKQAALMDSRENARELRELGYLENSRDFHTDGYYASEAPGVLGWFRNLPPFRPRRESMPIRRSSAQFGDLGEPLLRSESRRA